ncbi:hypothetical protein GQX73_g8614 [Xylaria multiplex]|uniref:Uncharacterized protein n=1 Tax=Xylaria multiplex TaxID=323545 RepID=A0A7C8IM76_9PEZI|nr:hypothetical protein GQX73_g8614 [Xylaria multiplex]
MFSTTAKNLTSNIPFRWTSGQVAIFEDWIYFKASCATTADLTPLLRALDLDGYEDIENMYGECVHDLIITKVRRKLARTKVTTQTENWLEKVEQDVQDHTSENDTRKTMVEPLLKSLPRVHTTFSPHRPNTLPTPAPNPRPSNLHRHQEVPRSGTVKGSSRSGSVLDPELDNGPVRTSRSRHVDGYSTRTRKHNNLEACIEKLKEAMADMSLEISRLPYDVESCALDTAAYDTGLDVEHLDNLVKEYIVG